MKPLETSFCDRAALVDYVRHLSGVADESVSELRGGVQPALDRLQQLDPVKYGRERNYLGGAVSGLSPYIRHGVVSPKTLAEDLGERFAPATRARFIQQLAWRDFFHRVHQAQPERIWQDHEPYKTGLCAADYAENLPEDIALGRTGVRLIDQLIASLLSQGVLHNHGRLYLAAYVVHWRRVRWQAGAKWFLQHLLDGDMASNNYSWQWVASTFSAKPYIFNLENVQRFAGEHLDWAHPSNRLFDATYDELAARLFPQQGVGGER
ncbi:MAG: FAD-binding domain-containing protein [Hydrogenovibrio sp.]